MNFFALKPSSKQLIYDLVTQAFTLDELKREIGMPKHNTPA